MPVRRSIRRGFVLVAMSLTQALATASVAPAADRVFWANFGANSISSANLDGTGGGSDLSLTGATVNQPQGVAIDAARNRIYWANSNGTTISVANLDGTGNGSDLNTSGVTVSTPRGVAIDIAHNRIYWANFDIPGTIGVANLDGTGNGSNLNTTGATVSRPVGVAVDPAHNRVYWANAGGNTISGANLDGTGNGSDLNTSGATVNFPEGVAVDPARNRIYWANPGAQKISVANLDGTGNGSDLNTTGAPINGPVGVALDPPHNRIYWVNDNTNSIASANLDGTGSGSALTTTGATVMFPAFVAVLHAPAAAGAPQVSGGAITGAALSCGTGTWEADLPGALLSRAPQTLSYAWQLGVTDIPGATQAAYTPTQPGTYVCRVTATNVAGSAVQSSAAIQVAAAVTVTVTPPATQKQAPAALPKLTSLVTFPGTKSCVSRRRFSIRLRVPRGSQVAQATVKLNGKQVVVRRGDRLRSTVDLRGLPKGRFTVSIELTFADGRAVKGSRHYRTCRPKHATT